MSIFNTIHECEKRAESAAYNVRQVAKALSVLGMNDAAYSLHEAVGAMLAGYEEVYKKASGELDEDLKRSSALAGDMFKLTLEMAESGALDKMGEYRRKNGLPNEDIDHV